MPDRADGQRHRPQRLARIVGGRGRRMAHSPAIGARSASFQLASATITLIATAA